MRYAALILFLFAGTANAETFKCQAGPIWRDDERIVVTVTINEDGKTGTIQVAGVTHQTSYRVAGFDRRWNFGLQDDGGFDYSFVLSPDGTAAYLDFSNVEAGEPARAIQTFTCK